MLPVLTDGGGIAELRAFTAAGRAAGHGNSFSEGNRADAARSVVIISVHDCKVLV